MARPKGSKTRSDDARAFITAVERELKKGGGDDNLIRLVCRKLTSAKSDSVPIMLRFLDMKFGRPTQTAEITGKDGEALKIIIEHINA